MTFKFIFSFDQTEVLLKKCLFFVIYNATFGEKSPHLTTLEQTYTEKENTTYNNTLKTDKNRRKDTKKERQQKKKKIININANTTCFETTTNSFNNIKKDTNKPTQQHVTLTRTRNRKTIVLCIQITVFFHPPLPPKPSSAARKETNSK